MPNLVVIDDERIVVEWVRTMISRSSENYQVVGSAGNGIQGLAVIRQKKPDIVITDIRIPGMDGLSLIEQVRTEFPSTAFIVISGWQEFSYAQRALKLQVMDYIDKPLNQENCFPRWNVPLPFLRMPPGFPVKKAGRSPAGFLKNLPHFWKRNLQKPFLPLRSQPCPGFPIRNSLWIL